MKAAQLRTVARLLDEHEIPDSKGLNFTLYTSDKCRIRFMDNEGNILNYMVERDGTYHNEPLGVEHE